MKELIESLGGRFVKVIDEPESEEEQQQRLRQEKQTRESHEREAICKALHGNNVQQAIAILNTTTRSGLDVAWVAVGGEALKQFTEALAQNKTITDLLFRSNQMKPEDAACIGKLLEENTCIRHFTINNNAIGNEGARYIAEALAHNKTITYLRIGDAKIDAGGMKHIADIIRTNPQLKYLHIIRNPFCNEGLRELIEPIKAHKKLKGLDIRGSGVGGREMSAFINAINENTSIQEIKEDCSDYHGWEVIATKIRIFTDNNKTALAQRNKGVLTLACSLRFLGEKSDPKLPQPPKDVVKLITRYAQENKDVMPWVGRLSQKQDVKAVGIF